MIRAALLAPLAALGAHSFSLLPQTCNAGPLQGCYADAWNRTIPVNPLTGSTNLTLETCAYACAQLSLPLAATEAGSQCYCAATVANISAYARPLEECMAAPCAGNPFQRCGGAWRVGVYNYSCSSYNPAGAAWLDPTQPVQSRVEDLIARLSDPSTPITALIAQLTQNGADVYAPLVQLPRYIVSQECLAGYDAGPIYIAPPVPQLNSSSAFPQPCNLGNTFDGELVRNISAAISDEARAAWVHFGRPALVCMSPVLNVARSPQWGRSYESYGEDPQVIAYLGSAYVQGMQYSRPGDPLAVNNSYIKIHSVAKHMTAYSVECWDPNGAPNQYPDCTVYRSFFNAVVDDTDLREGYLPGWERAVLEGGLQSVMASYNAINGVPNSCNGALLRGILQQEWGAQGYVISDADGVASIGNPPDNGTPGHGFTQTLEESAIAAVINGTSVSLEDDFDNGTSAYHIGLMQAVQHGTVTLVQLQEAARRALLPRFLTGAYDPLEMVPWNTIPPSVIESAEHHALAREAAAASIVLLTNNGSFLPLAPPSAGGPVKLAVVGPAANCTSCILNRYTGSPSVIVTHWLGIQAAAAAVGAQATYGGSEGAGAVAAVAAADVGIVLLTGYAEGESHDRENLGLPDDQLQLLSQLAATGKPLVVGIVSGGAVDASPALPVARALLVLGQGGMEAGNGFADVLFGAVNPSAALAVTMYRRSWENASDFLDMSFRASPGRGHRYLRADAAAQHVLFPFAYGLSYTSWTERIVSVTPSSISAADLAAGASVTVAVQVTNAGAVAGARAELLFLSRVGGGPDAGQWPNQWLARNGISKVRAVPAKGSAPMVTFSIMARDVSRWNATASTFSIQPGTFNLMLRDDTQGGVPGAPQGTFTVTP